MSAFSLTTAKGMAAYQRHLFCFQVGAFALCVIAGRLVSYSVLPMPPSVMMGICGALFSVVGIVTFWGAFRTALDMQEGIKQSTLWLFWISILTVGYLVFFGGMFIFVTGMPFV